ncbi:hypothetical protein WA158_008150 [Blastocystis sp. Blastoise]
MSKTNVCPHCGGTNIDTGTSGGTLTCIDCGTVLDENDIISSVEFSEGTGGSSNVVGTFVGPGSNFSFSSGSRYNFKESREITINGGKRTIAQYAAAMNLQSCVESAQKLFELAVQHQFTQGRRASYVCACCLYVVCRWENSPIMLIDFSDFLQCDIFSLGSVFVKLNNTLGLKVKPIDPSLYLHRFAAKMDLGDQTAAVTLTALRLTKRMQRDWIVRGRRPLGIIAASLLLAARMHGFERTKKQILSMVKICDSTINKRLAEFSNTVAGNLSIEEFNALAYQTNDFDIDEKGVSHGDDGIISSYPPCYIKNRVKEQEEIKSIEDIASEQGISKEQVLINLNIITPGSHYILPDKYNRSRLTKEGDEKKMYIDIENKLLTIMDQIGVTDEGDLEENNNSSEDEDINLVAEKVQKKRKNLYNKLFNKSDENIDIDTSSISNSIVDEKQEEKNDMNILTVKDKEETDDNNNDKNIDKNNNDKNNDNNSIENKKDLAQITEDPIHKESNQESINNSLIDIHDKEILNESTKSNENNDENNDENNNEKNDDNNNEKTFIKQEIQDLSLVAPSLSEKRSSNEITDIISIPSPKRSQKVNGTTYHLISENILPNGAKQQEWVPQEGEEENSDSELDELFLNEEEQKKRSELWEEENREWLIEREKKKKEKEKDQPVVRRRSRKHVAQGYRHPVKTAEEGIRRLVEAKKISNKVNYDKIKNLFD